MYDVREYIRQALSKGGGVGSKGGMVIGKTRSGAWIYASQDSKNHSVTSAMSDDHHQGAVAAAQSHPGYSADDHLDAAEAHTQRAAATTSQNERKASHKLSQAHSLASMMVRRHGGVRSPE